MSDSTIAIAQRAAIEKNPAWVQLLGLCPLLAVSNTVANGLGLALASGLVLVGSNTLISLLRHSIPTYVRLPTFVLIIASFTTLAVMLMEAFAYDLYVRIALFVQISVTNCMILGRAEAFASRQPVSKALADALGTAAGFAVALLGLGAARELLASGGLFRGMDQLFGAVATSWHLDTGWDGILLAALPPGAFLLAGLLLALMNHLRSLREPPSGASDPGETTT